MRAKYIILGLVLIPLALATIQITSNQITSSSNLLTIASNLFVNGDAEANNITADTSITTGTLTTSGGAVIGGTAVTHNIIPATGDWNLGSSATPWFNVFGNTIIATSKLCVAGTCVTSIGSINGTGTPNYLAKWDSTGSGLVSSIVYDSGTAVGIGTNSPTYLLDVAGIARTKGVIINKYGYSARSTAGFIDMPGPTSDYIITIQDGTGRVEHYWNSTPGTAPTYLVSNEPAGKILFNPSNYAWFVLYWAPAGTAGSAITWQTKFVVYQDGSVAATLFRDLQNTSYYVNPAGTSRVLDINALGSVATNKIEDANGNPRIEFNTASGSVIVYVG